MWFIVALEGIFYFYVLFWKFKIYRLKHFIKMLLYTFQNVKQTDAQTHKNTKWKNFSQSSKYARSVCLLVS